MKSLFGKVMGVIAGIIALLGISVGSVMASGVDISGKSPLFLEHGKSIGSGTICEHGSHVSHESHASHVSHSSGY